MRCPVFQPFGQGLLAKGFARNSLHGGVGSGWLEGECGAIVTVASFVSVAQIENDCGRHGVLINKAMRKRAKIAVVVALDILAEVAQGLGFQAAAKAIAGWLEFFKAVQAD